jgi:hypothetical protein
MMRERKKKRKRAVVCLCIHTSCLSNTQSSVINKRRNEKDSKIEMGSIQTKQKNSVHLSVTLFFSLQVPNSRIVNEWFIRSMKVAILMNRIEEVACRWFSYSSLNKHISSRTSIEFK